MASNNSNDALADQERQEALKKMDLVKIVKRYIMKAISDVGGYKAVLLDAECLRFISTVVTQTDLGENDVFCTERIDAKDHPDHKELKAICILRPTRENVSYLRHELQNPRFSQYYLYFTNILHDTLLMDLAEQDAEKELVQEVHEVYFDYIVLDPHHFTVPISNTEIFISPSFTMAPEGSSRGSTREHDIIDRLTQGISSLFLSLRRRPVIRYQNGSEFVTRLAISLYSLVYNHERSHFDFGIRDGDSSPVLLVLDRKDDPVTPLLTQWSYQAMVHELIGIDDNKIFLNSSKIPKDSREMVFSARQDEFLAKHIYSNFGDVGIAVKEQVEGIQGESSSSRQLSTIEDMRNFVLQYSDFSQRQRQIAKHVNVMSIVSEIVASKDLMATSEVEQDLACAPSPSASATHDAILRVLQNPKASHFDKLRLVLLFVLRFEGDRERLHQLSYRLSLEGVSDEWIKTIDKLIKYAGKTKRRGDLYGTRSVFSYARRVVKSMKGIENVYTQHMPLLTETLRLLGTNDLPQQMYPYASEDGGELLHWQSQYKKCPPRDVIVFIIGGTTYEEAKAVDELNQREDVNMRVILGGTGILNSRSFVDAIKASEAQRLATFGIMKDIKL